GTRSDVSGFLEQNGCRRTLGDKRKRFVFEDSDHDRENVACLLLCRGVKFLAKRHDVDAAWTECGAHPRRRVSLSCGNLEFDVCDYFFGHKLVCHSERSEAESKNLVASVLGF